MGGSIRLKTTFFEGGRGNEEDTGNNYGYMADTQSI